MEKQNRHQPDLRAILRRIQCCLIVAGSLAIAVAVNSNNTPMLGFAIVNVVFGIIGSQL